MNDIGDWGGWQEEAESPRALNSPSVDTTLTDDRVGGSIAPKDSRQERWTGAPAVPQGKHVSLHSWSPSPSSPHSKSHRSRGRSRAGSSYPPDSTKSSQFDNSSAGRNSMSSRPRSAKEQNLTFEVRIRRTVSTNVLNMHPRIRSILQNIWKLLDRDGQNTISREQYTRIFTLAHETEHGEQDPQQTYLLAESDWVQHSQGFPSMDFDRFSIAWLHIVEQFDPLSTPEAYAAFSEKIYHKLLKEKTTSRKSVAASSDVNSPISKQTSKGVASRSKSQATLASKQTEKGAKKSKSKASYTSEKNKIRVHFGSMSDSMISSKTGTPPPSPTHLSVVPNEAVDSPIQSTMKHSYSYPRPLHQPSKAQKTRYHLPLHLRQDLQPTRRRGRTQEERIEFQWPPLGVKVRQDLVPQSMLQEATEEPQIVCKTLHQSTSAPQLIGRQPSPGEDIPLELEIPKKQRERTAAKLHSSATQARLQQEDNILAKAKFLRFKQSMPILNAHNNNPPLNPEPEDQSPPLGKPPTRERKLPRGAQLPMQEGDTRRKTPQQQTRPKMPWRSESELEAASYYANVKHCPDQEDSINLPITLPKENLRRQDSKEIVVELPEPRGVEEERSDLPFEQKRRSILSEVVSLSPGLRNLSEDPAYQNTPPRQSLVQIDAEVDGFEQRGGTQDTRENSIVSSLSPLEDSISTKGHILQNTPEIMPVILPEGEVSADWTGMPPKANKQDLSIGTQRKMLRRAQTERQKRQSFSNAGDEDGLDAYRMQKAKTFDGSGSDKTTSNGWPVNSRPKSSHSHHGTNQGLPGSSQNARATTPTLPSTLLDRSPPHQPESQTYPARGFRTRKAESTSSLFDATSSVATGPSALEHSTMYLKNRYSNMGGGVQKVAYALTCTYCIAREATLWCDECKLAYCVVCFPQIKHHRDTGILLDKTQRQPTVQQIAREELKAKAKMNKTTNQRKTYRQTSMSVQSRGSTSPVAEDEESFSPTPQDDCVQEIVIQKTNLFEIGTLKKGLAGISGNPNTQKQPNDVMPDGLYSRTVKFSKNELSGKLMIQQQKRQHLQKKKNKAILSIASMKALGIIGGKDKGSLHSGAASRLHNLSSTGYASGAASVMSKSSSKKAKPEYMPPVLSPGMGGHMTFGQRGRSDSSKPVLKNFTKNMELVVNAPESMAKKKQIKNINGVAVYVTDPHGARRKSTTLNENEICDGFSQSTSLFTGLTRDNSLSSSKPHFKTVF